MVNAFILVKTVAGKSTEIQERIHGTESVLEAHVVAGQYDVVVEAEAEEVYAVIDTVTTDLRELDGIVDTRTYICLD